VENTKEYNRVLLHVENDGPLCAAETSQSRRGRVKTETGLHSQLVSIYL